MADQPTPQPNPYLQQLLSTNPEAQALLSGLAANPLGANQPFTEERLQAAISGSVFDTTGRSAATGRDLKRNLPAWVKNIELTSPGLFEDHSDVVDPYFGVLSNQGDDVVYMGERKPKNQPAAPAKLGDPAFEGIDPIEAHDTGERASIDTEPRHEPVVDPIEAHDTGHRSGLETVTATSTEAPKYSNRKDKVSTVQQVLNLPYTWDEDKILETMKLMRHAGINVTTFDQLASTWQGLVQRASMIYSVSEGTKKVTPWDVLDMYKSESLAAGNLTDYENGSKTTTSRSVSSITEGQAWDSLRSTVANMLGRDPSDEELRDFTYRMNQLAAKNPSITKTITKYKAGEAVSSSSNTHTGFTGSDMAEAAYDNAQNDPNYGEYQAASTYFNAALSALGAIGQT